MTNTLTRTYSFPHTRSVAQPTVIKTFPQRARAFFARHTYCALFAACVGLPLCVVLAVGLVTTLVMLPYLLLAPILL